MNPVCQLWATDLQQRATELLQAAGGHCEVTQLMGATRQKGKATVQKNFNYCWLYNSLISPEGLQKENGIQGTK